MYGCWTDTAPERERQQPILLRRFVGLYLPLPAEQFADWKAGPQARTRTASVGIERVLHRARYGPSRLSY